MTRIRPYLNSGVYCNLLIITPPPHISFVAAGESVAEVAIILFLSFSKVLHSLSTSLFFCLTTFPSLFLYSGGVGFYCLVNQFDIN